MSRYICPNCSSVHRLDPLLSGPTFTCPQCGRQLQITVRKIRTATQVLGPLPDGIDAVREAREPAARPLRQSPGLPVGAFSAAPEGVYAGRPRIWLVPAVLALASGLAWFLTLICWLNPIYERADMFPVLFFFALWLGGCAAAFWQGRTWQARIFGVLASFVVAVCIDFLVADRGLAPRTLPANTTSSVASSSPQLLLLTAPPNGPGEIPATGRRKTDFTPSELYREIDRRRMEGTLDDLQFQIIRVTGLVKLVFPGPDGRPEGGVGPDENGNFGFTLRDRNQPRAGVGVVTGQVPFVTNNQAVTAIGTVHYNLQHGDAFLLNARITDH